MSSSLTPPVALSATTPVARADFPTWLPAMLVKELRQGLRTRGFVGAFIAFQAIMVLLMLGTVLGSAFGNNMTRAIMANTITGFFWTLLGAQLLLSTPARALGTLQVELDSRALDLLVLTRLTAWRIVLGKWGSLMAQALLLFIAMLPYGIVRYFMGSVDLVEDAVRCAALLGGCAVLTAAGLACSGMPKLVRVIVPIVVVMGFQATRPLMMMMGSRGGSSVGSPFSLGGGVTEAWLLWLNGALVLGILLVTAVRRIAPPAENHVLLTRGLALLTVVPVPLLAALGKTTAARGQSMFAAVLLGLVGAVELSSLRWPMLAHWRPWAVRGAVARWAGRFALPGWPSAFVFMVLAGLLVGLGFSLPGVMVASDAMRAGWLAVLAVSGLVFPAVVLSFFSRASRSPGALYGLVLGLSSLVAAIAAIVGNGPAQLKGALAFASILPAAGFWVTLFAPEEFTESVFVGQAAVAGAVLGVAWWRARIYWRELARIDARARAKA